MPAYRNAINTLYEENLLQNGGNAGLILTRYLKEQKQDGNNDGNKEGNKAREVLLNAAVSAIGNVGRNQPNFYELAFNRRSKILKESYGTSGTFKIINGRMIIGLGGGSVLETGITLNHIYGTPIIPGSALKGLAAHYCADVWGNENGLPNFKGAVRNERGKIVTPGGEDYDFMFGSTEDAGFLTFYDAWIKPSFLSESLVPDVMTPHYGNYYKYNGKDAPTDFCDPNPVTFLSVRGEFEICVCCENGGEEGKNWECIAMELLKQALEDWGIGGKTSSGYGRGTLKYEDNSLLKHENNTSVNHENTIDASTHLFLPGQQVEAIYKSTNKKGNTQVEVMLNSVTITARWEGDTLSVPKGSKFQATVKSYDPNSNPKLVLCSKL